MIGYQIDLSKNQRGSSTNQQSTNDGRDTKIFQSKNKFTNRVSEVVENNPQTTTTMGKISI